MTLHIAQFCSKSVIQVSDRLVTTGGKPFDEISNKNLLYFAKNGVISIGYTGNAFLEGEASDHWIAEKLIGSSIEKNGRSFKGMLRPPMLSFVHLKQWHQIGIVEQLLVDELSKTFQKMPLPERLAYFGIQITGWLCGKRKTPRPIYSEIIKNTDTTTMEIRRVRRHFGRSVGYGYIPDGNKKFIDFESLFSDHKTIRSPNDSEKALVKAIRCASVRTPWIGPNCISVLLSPPHIYPVARIRYIGNPSFLQIISRRRQGEKYILPAAFSPWIIGPGLIQAPSVISGKTVLGCGNFKISIETPELKTLRFQSAMGSISRPNDPTQKNRLK